MASLLSAVASAIIGGDSSTSSSSPPESISTTTTSSTSKPIVASTSDSSIATTSASTSSPETTSATGVINPNTGPGSSSSSLSNASTGASSSNTASSSSLLSSLSVTGPSSTISSTLKAAVTTSVQATLTSTDSNGEVFITVIETQSILSAGSVVTSTASSNDNSTTSSSHTGAIVGGVLGGISGLLIILGILFLLLRRFRRQRELDEAFDGNFDPDHIVRSGGLGFGSEGGKRESCASGFAYAGGEKAKMKKQAKRASNALECISSDMPEGSSPEIEQLMVAPSRNHLLDEEGMDDDDGMGGRLNGTSTGGGIVTPYTHYNSPSLLGHSIPSSPAPSSSYHTPSPYHSTFPLLGSASSDGHGAMRLGREAFSGRPPSMSMSASASMSGHGPALSYSASGYGRPPSMTGGSVYGYPHPGMTGFSPGSPPLSHGVHELPVEGRRHSNSPVAIQQYPTGPVHAINSGLAVTNPDSSNSSSMYAGVPEEDTESLEEIPPTYLSLNLSG